LVEGSHTTKQDQDEHEAKQLADSFLKSPSLGGCADEVGLKATPTTAAHVRKNVPPNVRANDPQNERTTASSRRR
jgi:hypothetical protein